MGLRCLLGHDFTEPTTEREREERGDEVIATVRRVKECRRCGETRVVSENKEVTSVSQPDRSDRPSREEGGVADRESPGWASDRSGVEAADADPDPAFDHPEADLDGVDTDVEDDAEIIRAGPSEGETGTDAEVRGRGEWPDADVNRSTVAARTGRSDPTDGSDGPDRSGGTADQTGSGGAAGTGDADAGDPPFGGAERTDPADEDAEFIDAEADADDDAGADGTDGQVAWPDHDGADEGFDAAFVGSDDGDGGDATGAEAGSTEYVEAESDPLDATADVDATTDSRWGTPGAGTTAGAEEGNGAVPGVELRTASDDPDAEYVCPECGEREPVGASSMRAGDICPECKRGYIEERSPE